MDTCINGILSDFPDDVVHCHCYIYVSIARAIIFTHFTNCLNLEALFHKKRILSYVDDYTKDMTTFMSLVLHISNSRCFCNAEVAGFGEIFVQ